MQHPIIHERSHLVLLDRRREVKSAMELPEMTLTNDAEDPRFTLRGFVALAGFAAFFGLAFDKLSMRI
jgi:hypothetical protein